MRALLRTELVLQARGGFWTVYAVLCVAYLGVLQPLPPEVVDRVLPVLVFSDPAVLGLVVVGALVLLERREGVLQALAHAPIAPASWIAAKVITLTALAVVVAGIVSAGSGALVRPDLLLLAVIPTSVFCVLLGVVVVSRTSTFNRFLAWMAVVTTPLSLPAGELLLGADWPPMRWLPTGATTDLLRGAFGAPLSTGEVVWDVAMLTVSCVGAGVWAEAWTRRYLWRRT
ncbi:MAG: hypothetical protein AAF602_09385 [Myxococcota bacterium]